MNRTYDRIGAATGAFFVIAIMVGGGMERSGVSGLERDRTLVNQVGFAWAILGFAAFVAFVGYLYRVLRRAEGSEGWLAAVSFGAGLLYLAVKVGSAAPIMAGFYRRDDLTPDLARTLVDLNDAAFVVSGLMFGLFAAASAAVCLAHRLLPRWLGWFGLVSGVLAVAAGTAGMLDMQSYNPLAFVAGLLWTLIASILLAVRRESAVPAPVAAGHAVALGAAS